MFWKRWLPHFLQQQLPIHILLLFKDLCSVVHSKGMIVCILLPIKTSVFGKDESGSGWLTRPAKRLMWTHFTLSLFHFMFALFSSVLITIASSKSDKFICWALSSLFPCWFCTWSMDTSHYDRDKLTFVSWHAILLIHSVLQGHSLLLSSVSVYFSLSVQGLCTLVSISINVPVLASQLICNCPRWVQCQLPDITLLIPCQGLIPFSSSVIFFIFLFSLVSFTVIFPLWQHHLILCLPGCGGVPGCGAQQGAAAQCRAGVPTNSCEVSYGTKVWCFQSHWTLPSIQGAALL